MWEEEEEEAFTNPLCVPIKQQAKHADFCGDVYHIVLSGLKLIRDMTCAVIEQSTWKLTHPCTNENLDKIFKKEVSE